MERGIMSDSFAARAGQARLEALTRLVVTDSLCPNLVEVVHSTGTRHA
jgi:hypothetical protein